MSSSVAGPASGDRLSSLRRHLAISSGEDFDVGRLSELLAEAEAQRPVFSRTHFSPGHFTASGFVLSPDSASLLLIFHRKLRLWLQPGGHFEAGDETFVDAARREVLEETGLSGVELLRELVDVDIHQIPALGGEPEHLHYDLRVLFRAGSAETTPSDEVGGCRWFSLRELSDPDPKFRTDESVRRVARRLEILFGGPGAAPAC